MTNDDMRTDWNARARANAMHFIAFRYGQVRQDLTEFYTDGAREAVDLVQPFLEKLLFDPHGKRVLEIGCGIGRLFPGFRKIGFSEVWGVDVSSEMISLAAKTCPVRDAHLVVGDGRNLSEFDHDQFDYCFSYLVFQHIPEREIVWNYLREIFRVLKPGGGFQVQFMQKRTAGQRLVGLLPEGLGKTAILVREQLSAILHHEAGVPSPLPGRMRTWYVTPLNAEDVRSRLDDLGFSGVEIIPDSRHPWGISCWAIGRK